MSKQKSKSIYQQENGNWGYRFVLTIDGRTITQRRVRDEKGNPFKTEKQAMRAREKAIRKAKEEAYMAKQQPIVRKRIREVYEEYCEYGRTEKAYSTIRKQEALWTNHILDRFGSTYLDNVRVADIQDFLAELYHVKGYAYGYVEAFLKQFYLIFGQAYSRNYMSTVDYNKLCVNRNTKIKMPSKKSTDVKDIEVYTEKELEILDKHFKGTTVETAYMIGRYCGLRVGECYGIIWDRVNLEKGYISIERQMQTQNGVVKLVPLKTVNARRKVYICDTLREYLTELKAKVEEYEIIYAQNRRQNEKVIYDEEDGELSSLQLINTLPNGRIQTEHAIRHHTKHVREKHNLHFAYHNLRHTYGTRLALMNTPEHILLNQMGHSKSATTHKYYLAISEDGINSLKNNLEKL